MPADSSTGIKGSDFATAQAFERRHLTRDATTAELERSFAHLKEAVATASADRVGERVKPPWTQGG